MMAWYAASREATNSFTHGLRKPPVQFLVDCFELRVPCQEHYWS